MIELVVNANPKAQSAWAQVLRGRVTASGAPSRARVAQWAATGATDVVTLQRDDEHATWLPDACQAANLHWHHFPLSGRKLDRPEDQATLARMPELVEILRSDQPRSLVVHCSAGLHRTGVCLYVILRHAGHTQDEAIAIMASARPLTAEELTRTGKRGSLHALAEAHFHRQIEGEPP